MKVMCIDAKYRDGDLVTGVISEGEYYTVVMERDGFDCYNNIKHCYQLQEDENYVYQTDRFITLSDIDETELVNERQLVNT